MSLPRAAGGPGTATALRLLSVLSALWNVLAGLPVLFDLVPGVDVLMAGSGGLAVLLSPTVVLDINQAAIPFATAFERLPAIAPGRPRRGTPTRLHARGEDAFLTLTALPLLIMGVHALTWR